MEQAADGLIETGPAQELAKCMSGRCESARHRYACVAEVLNELAERGVLAAYHWHVIHPEPFESNRKSVSRYRMHKWYS
jgi:hypothetical protein